MYFYFKYLVIGHIEDVKSLLDDPGLCFGVLLCSVTSARELIWLLGTGGGVDVHGTAGAWYIVIHIM